MISRRQLAIYVADQLVGGAPRARLVKQVAAYLAANKLVGQIDLILKDVALALQERHSILAADVRSRYPLTASLRKDLQAALKAQTKANQVILSESADDTLLGGLVATTPELELDLSVRGRLNHLISNH